MGTKQNTFTITLLWAFLAQAQSEIAFPISVGMKPESITKGFYDNYYVTVMNVKEPGDGELVEVSKNGIKVLQKVLMSLKELFSSMGIYISLMLPESGKWITKERPVFFVNKADVPGTVLYLNDVSLDGKENGMYVADMGATQYMRDADNDLWLLDS
ncbi:hypothetical protein [Cellulophaga sp. Ld12]|uniref:hypothetical protein n=1 Tax=Cellulophaga sp. Ld12 TaxID=3229535 RepID=UPI00386DB4B8